MKNNCKIAAYECQKQILLLRIQPTNHLGQIVLKPFLIWIKFLYELFFKIVGFFYRIYKTNRDWVDGLKSGEKATSFLQNAAVIIVLGWILIWFFAPEGSGDQLTEEVKETIGGLKSLSD